MAKQHDSDSGEQSVSRPYSAGGCSGSYGEYDTGLSTYLNQCRRRAATSTDVSTFVSSKKQLLEIEAALHDLPLADQLLLRMAYFDQRADGEIARELSMDAECLEQRLHGAFARLRRSS